MKKFIAVVALIAFGAVASAGDGPRRFQPLTAESRDIRGMETSMRQLQAAYANALVEAAAIRGVKAVTWDDKDGVFVESPEPPAAIASTAPVQTSSK